MSPEQAREFLDSLSPDLKERVKAFGLACMDAAQRNEFALDKETVENYESFRALCAPEVKQ